MHISFDARKNAQQLAFTRKAMQFCIYTKNVSRDLILTKNAPEGRNSLQSHWQQRQKDGQLKSCLFVGEIRNELKKDASIE